MNIINVKSKYNKFILSKCTYTVGRLEGDIIVNDKSVSRIHARLSYVPDKQAILVEDLSKFGTSINSSSLVNKRGFANNGDIITFGAQPGVEFQCSIIQLDLIMSTLTQSDKVKLIEYTNNIGGRLLNDWNDCVRYLVMSNLKITYKVICALIKQVPIVTTDFIKEMHDYFIGKRSDKPLPENFVPPTTDVNIVNKSISFANNINRRTLFANKTFYFLTAKKQSHLELAIVSAGGAIVLFTEMNFNYQSTLEQLSCNDSIVMYETTETSLVTQVYTILQRLHKRPVIDSEIGFAVLHVTTEEYCNPLKKCTDSIYSETRLTQFLTVNPFHMDQDTQNVTFHPQDQLPKKRTYNEKENSGPKSDNVSKKRKVISSQGNLANESLSNEATQKIDKESKHKGPKKHNHELITKSLSERKTEVPQPNITKKNDYFQDFLKDNNVFFSETSKPYASKPDPIAKNTCISDEFDDEFDKIEIPKFTSLGIKENEELSMPNDKRTRSDIQAVDREINQTNCEVNQKKFSDHPIKLVPSNPVIRAPLEPVEDSITNNVPKSDCRITTFERLVVVDLAQVNGNHKPFRKASQAYFHVNEIAMEVFNKKNY